MRLRHGRRPGLGLQSECPRAKNVWSLLTFHCSARCTVSMPSILLVWPQFYGINNWQCKPGENFGELSASNLVLPLFYTARMHA